MVLKSYMKLTTMIHTSKLHLTLSLMLLYVISSHCQNTKSPFCGENRHVICPPNLISSGSCSLNKLFSQDCKYLNLKESLFGPKIINDASSLGDINIEPYQYIGKTRSHPNVNISFINVTWNSMFVRLAVGDGIVTKCLNFTISPIDNHVVPSSVLFWDCEWFIHAYSEYPMSIEYQATDKRNAVYRKLFFQLPKHVSIETKEETFQLLVYREYHQEYLTIYWSRPPEYLSVSMYRVNITECNETATSVSKIVNGTKISLWLHEFCICCNVSVQPCFNASGQWGSPTYLKPFVFIRVGKAGIGSLIAVILFGVLVTAVVIYCLIFFFKFYLWRKSKWQKCIVVYEPTSAKHLNVVKKLVLFLKHLHIPILFAENAIVEKEDPAVWWARELNAAELLLIISSPKALSQEDYFRSTIYASVFTKGRVEDYLRDTISKRVIKILLPYCQKSDFSDCLQTKRQCYHIFDNRFEILQELKGIHNVKLPNFILSLLYSYIFDANEWTELNNAIKEFSNKAMNSNEWTELNNAIEEFSKEAMNSKDGSRGIALCSESASSITDEESESEDDVSGDDTKQQRHNNLLRNIDDDDSSEAESVYSQNSDGYEGKEENSALSQVLSDNDFIKTKQDEEQVDIDRNQLFKFFK